jgi:hypothetical protein
MKYSVIIPTMYFHVGQLTSMLAVYERIVWIGEVLIINNNTEKQVDFNFSKVRVIGDGVNKYVNPSWKFGVENAKYENIVLANDDITITGNLEKLFFLSSFLIKPNIVLGPSVKCYPELNKFMNTEQIGLSKQKIDKRKITYGFGVFMLMKKSTFQNTSIPDDFLIWYGDHILCLVNEAWEFSGLGIITSMRGTTSRINLKNQAILERNAFRNYKV